MRQALRRLMALHPAAATRRLALAIANQRSTLVFLRPDGSPARAIVPWWETTGLDPAAVDEHDRETFRRLTGLPLLPNWWAGKLARRLRHRAPSLASLRPATVDTLLLAWLTGGRTFATDTSNAARTGLVDRRDVRRRSSRLRNLFGLAGTPALASIKPSVSDFGSVALKSWPAFAARGGRIAAVVGDAGAGLMGMTAGLPGIMAITLGTGGFLHLPCTARTLPPDGIYLAPAWSTKARTQWALEAAVPGMARALASGSRRAGIAVNAVESMTPRPPRKRLLAILAPDGFGALGPAEARGIALVGPWRSSPPAERLGALLEGLAHLIARAIARFPSRPSTIIVSGGLSQSDYLLQAIADFSGLRVSRCRSADATLHGAAMLASIGLQRRLDPLTHDRAHEPTLGFAERRRQAAAFEAAILTLC